MLKDLRVNALVEVRLGDSRHWLPSRVEDVDVDGDRVVLAAPLQPAPGPGTGPGTGGVSSIVRPRLGERLSVRWRASRGIGTLNGHVVHATVGQLPSWTVAVDGDPVVIQRRRFVRVPVTLPVLAVVPGEVGVAEQRWLLTTVDLAEGGMRCLAPDPVEEIDGPSWPAEGDVELHFAIAGTRFVVPARIVWSSPAVRGRVYPLSIAFKFVGLPRRWADQLRRFVFSQEARQGQLIRK